MSASIAAIDGKYEIVAKLKEGGMGAIYKVRHRLLDEIRVIKVLRPQFEDDLELRERFAREARSAIKLRHPNVVQIFDFSLEETGVGSIVMEFIEGVDLGQVVQAGLPSLALVLEIARQSLRALGFLHQHGFVHRDVSPDNLMLTLDVDRKPLVKLIDLGIAKRRDAPEQITVSGSFLGKFRYASPEHFGSRGPNGVEARSDLYTFGLVFYELLTGRYPIPGQGTSQLIAAHLFQAPLDFPYTDLGGRVPEEVRRMVMRSLAKSPDERPASAGDWIAEIERLQRQWPLDETARAEAERLVQRIHPAGEPSTPAGTGTQKALDRQFRPERTPIRASEEPTHISSVALPPPEENTLRRRMMAMVAEAELLIDRGSDEAALALLRQAQQMAAPLVQSRAEAQAELAKALQRLNRKVLSRTATREAISLPAPATQNEVNAPPTPQNEAVVPPPPPPVDPNDPELPPGGLLATLAEIEKLREEGRLVAAWALLRKALARFGENHPGLIEIRADLAEELLDSSRG